ncbi:MAG: bacteriohemerythrin [Betaproteobacteria bacterium]|nr:bacteriohemerythrin [Betaproteobacteria bacterium]MCL2885959.1 bacteriohemerythrin [Betaproteobacteria bacterium]
MPIAWTPDLNIGIDVIDHQHRRIVDFVNDLEAAQALGDKKKLKSVLDDCVDYTLSHFAFEESLQAEANYPYCKPHKKVHELFTRKVGEYMKRLEEGEDVAEELHDTLARWLVSHIKRDDADFAPYVKATLPSQDFQPSEEKKKMGWFRRLFG